MNSSPSFWSRRALPALKKSPMSILTELLSIEGIDDGTAGELQARARDYIEEQNRKALEAAKELGVEQSLV